MKILITGATGLLGNNIARSALSNGHSVTTLSRSPSTSPALRDLNCRHVQCDLNAPDILEQLADVEVDCVVHSAALIHIGWKRIEDSLRVNEKGTRTLVDWANERKLRGVHISTVNVLPVGRKDCPAHEDSVGDGQLPSAYVLSKRAAQVVVNESVAAGNDWYSVYPGFLLGPNDWQLSSGKMVKPLQRFMPWAPAGGCSVCDPRDVASSILKLLESGGSFRDYVMAGENLTYLEFWTMIAKRMGTKPPVIAMRLPSKVISQIWADAVNTLRSSEMAFNSAAIEMGQQFHFYSSERARKDLGYRNRDLNVSINDAIEWLAEQGALPIYSKREQRRAVLAQ